MLISKSSLRLHYVHKRRGKAFKSKSVGLSEE
jgi:hypothetical protein